MTTVRFRAALQYNSMHVNYVSTQMMMLLIIRGKGL